MNRFETAFLNLVKKVNEDSLKVVDDCLTYIIARLSINEDCDVKWYHPADITKEFSNFMYLYLDFMQEQLQNKFWYDAWGDMFMENSGNFKSFRGQFFTPSAVSDLCARISFCDMHPLVSGRQVINDCACGSARMLLAAQEQAFNNKLEQPYLVGEDIDGICCKMAAVNLAVHGCFGEVIRHDSLKEPGEFRYGYIINESLASGMDYPCIRFSADKNDFWKMRNTILPIEEGEQLSLF